MATHHETSHQVTQSKNYIAAAIHGVGDVSAAIVDAVSDTGVHTLGGARAVSNEAMGLLSDTVTGGVHAVAAVSGEVGTAAKSIMLGTLKGAHQVGTASVEAVSYSAAALVRGAS